VELRAVPTGMNATEASRDKAFQAFWSGLGPDRRVEFEAAAVKAATSLKRDGYLRGRQLDGSAFEKYRHVILRDHFERNTRALVLPPSE
jgi:hypothetical protein